MSVFRIDNFKTRKHDGHGGLALSVAGGQPPNVVTKESRASRRVSFMLLVVLGTVFASLLILKFAPAPFFWVWLTWAMAMFAATFGLRGSWSSAVLFNLGVVACALAVIEGYLTTHEYTVPIFPDGLYVHDDLLGWAPKKGARVRAIKPNPTGLFHGPRGLLFNVSYAIDSDGLRVAPPWRKDELVSTALFFGCSFTFGDGLKDDETLPYQVGVQSGGHYRIFNFAFGGYSPAQMLAAIEHGMVRHVVDTTPGYAFYIATPIHVWRVAGRVAWGRHAPRYVLDVGGTVHQAGYFDDRTPLAQRLGLRRVVSQLNKSAMWRLATAHDSRISEDDIRLYLAMVCRSRELLTAQYPNLQFHVILWPNQNVPQQRWAYEKLRDGFRAMGVPLHLVEDILPAYNTDRYRFVLSSADTHPNALANRLLAQYIVKEILHQ